MGNSGVALPLALGEGVESSKANASASLHAATVQNFRELKCKLNV